jgi:hypothetical protein
LNKAGLPLFFKQHATFKRSSLISGGMFFLTLKFNIVLHFCKVSTSVEWENNSSDSFIKPFLFNFPKHEAGFKNKLKVKTTDSLWSNVSQGKDSSTHILINFSRA